MGQQDSDEAVGNFQETVYAVGEAGSYNIMGNLSMWGTGTSMGDSSDVFYMHRAEVALDMTFDSWLFGFIKAQSWGAGDITEGFHIPEAYIEAYFADWFSARMGKQLLFYGDGLVWSDRLLGPPTASVLLGEKVFLNAHFIYMKPKVITDKATVMSGSVAGVNIGPFYAALEGLYKPASVDTGQADIWAGANMELDKHPFDISLELGYHSVDTLNNISACFRADMEPGPFNIGVSGVMLDQNWVNPFDQNPVMYYDERGWGALGDVFTFGYLQDPFMFKFNDITSLNLHLAYDKYLDFIKPDLMLKTRLDVYSMSTAITGDSTTSIGNEADLGLHFTVTKTVDMGVVAGYFMANEDYGLDNGYSLRLWVAKDFYFE